MRTNAYILGITSLFSGRFEVTVSLLSSDLLSSERRLTTAA